MSLAASALICFFVMWAIVVAAAAMLRSRIVAYREFGLGGDQENLDLARRYAREGLFVLLAMIAALATAIALAEYWSPSWREAATAWALDVMSVMVGCCALAAFAYSVRQQWARSGSYFGMLKGGFASLCMVALFMLTLRWRFGT